MESKRLMKMYIVIKNDVPDKFVPVITAHASLACYLKFQEKKDMQNWISGVFKKVVCITTESEFNRLKNETDFISLTESNLNNEEVCLAFCPRKEYAKIFKYLKMWTPQNI